MRLLRAIIALALLGLFTGCGEPQPQLSAPKTYRSGTITFDYPKNWKITEDLVNPAIHYLFVETPGDALVILQSFPLDEAEGLAAFTKAYSESAATEMPVGKMVQSTFTDMPETGGYEQIEEEFNVNLFGETVPHRRLYETKGIGDRQVILIFQVATEDFATAEPGFELMRNSLSSLQKAEQGGAVQPATAAEPKSVDNEKTKPESEGGLPVAVGRPQTFCSHQG